MSKIKVNPKSIPSASLFPKTLIEHTAGKRYKIGWDETVDATHPPRKFEERDQFQIIPCRPGNVYKYDDGVLSWYCPNRLKGTYALKRLGDWFTVQIECEEEWTFNFSASKFREVAKCARPYLKRQISEETKERLKRQSKRISASRSEQTAAPGEVFPLIPCPLAVVP